MPKIHKAPIKLRPVISCIKSTTLIFSTRLDLQMKQLLHLIPYYIQDSLALLTELKQLEIPTSAKLFTVDATAMYANINNATGLTAPIRDLILTYHFYSYYISYRVLPYHIRNNFEQQYIHLLGHLLASIRWYCYGNTSSYR